MNARKYEECRKIIASAKIELEKINKQTAESEDLQAKEVQREEYFKVRSQLQVKNAQIERERIKLQKAKTTWLQKR